MGVKNLWKILKDCGEKANLKNKTLAIDTSIWMHQYKDMPRDLIIYSISKRIFKIIYNEISPVFVFDGAAPKIKKQVLESRRRDRLKSILLGVANNRECKICKKPLKECVHVNCQDDESLNKIFEDAQRRLKDHDYNWGEISDEFDNANLEQDRNETFRSDDNHNIYKKHETKEMDCYLSFDPDSIKKLSKHQKLKKLIELRSKRKMTTLICEDDLADEFSLKQIANVKKRNLVTNMLKDLNSKSRILSDCTSFSELKIDQDSSKREGCSEVRNKKEKILAEKDDESENLEMCFDQVLTDRDEWNTIYEKYKTKSKSEDAMSNVESQDRMINEIEERIKINSILDLEGTKERPIKHFSRNFAKNNTKIISTKPDSKELNVKKTEIEDFYSQSSDVFDLFWKSDDSMSEYSAQNVDYVQIKEKLESMNSQIKLENEGLVLEESKKVESIIKTIITLFGIPFVDSPGEADPQCWYLFKNGLIDGVISEDSDMLIYGTTTFKNFFRKDRDIKMYTAESIRKNAGFDKEKLIKLSFLLGSDYCSGIKGLGAKKAVQNIDSVAQGQIEHLIEIYNGENVKKIKNLKYGIFDLRSYKDFLLMNGLERDKIDELLTFAKGILKMNCS